MTEAFDLLLRAPLDAPLRGELQVPPDKSISHRALMLAALATGTSRLQGVLASEDVLSTLKALRQLGTCIEVEQLSPSRLNLLVEGVGQQGFHSPDEPLDMGNSGTSMRLLAGLLCGRQLRVTLIGDASLMCRPMQRIVQPLRQMGADIRCTPEGTAPLEIYPAKAVLQGMEYRLPVASAQVKTAVLLAGLTASGETVVDESVDSLSRNHTELLLAGSGRLQQRRVGGRQRAIVCGDDAGGKPLPPFNMSIPSDCSSAAFAVLAAVLRPGSHLHLPALGVNPTRTGFLRKLQQMQASIQLSGERTVAGEPVADVEVRGGTLQNGSVQPHEVPAMIDEIPVLAVAGHYGRGEMRVMGVDELRHKESNRLERLMELLQQQGDERVQVALTPDGDGFCIDGLSTADAQMAGGSMDSGGDHRMAMAFAIAGPRQQDLRIRNCACVRTSYPDFVASMSSVGLEIAEVTPNE